eukprot:COSAG06_NODE_3873_length_4814_cov_3.323648_8_plen_64_part_00
MANDIMCSNAVPSCTALGAYSLVEQHFNRKHSQLAFSAKYSPAPHIPLLQYCIIKPSLLHTDR